MRLRGKTALVAGASRNTGRAIAETFAREGAQALKTFSRPGNRPASVRLHAGQSDVPPDLGGARGGGALFKASLACWLVLLGALAPAARAASADPYPAKPIRLVTAEASGGNDYIARMIVQGIAGSLGQQVVVDNRGGAGGAIAMEIAARARPDGYTLLFYANNIWLIPLLRRHVPYDAVRDFAPITWAARSPNIVVVHPSLPVRSIAELVALARARPGELNYAASGIGSSTHLAMELFKSMTGVDIVRVPFRGNGPALNALIAGQPQVMIPTAGSVAPHLGSGRVRARAVTSAQPSPLAPGLPTVAAAGLPGYESMQIYGFYAPAGTPAAIVRRLNAEFVRVLGLAEVRERMLASGVEPVGSSPDVLSATMKSEIVRMRRVIQQAGIRPE